jgi:chemosensory pili system protein ChpA (sensor histidine kinase/response regulator)
MSMAEKPLAFVIEDDAEQQKIFSRAIEMAGFSVQSITNGADALACLDEEIPALVILDLHLPKFSGDEILRRIRSQERLAAVPVILATADPLLADTLREESDLVLLKPISFIQLRDLATRLRSTA